MVARAHESIDAARLLLEHGHPGFAASRAYFAMFYLAEALLEGRGLAFSKHAAVIAAFGREFARPGAVPTELHRFLIEGQELRHAGDYGTGDEIAPEAAGEQIDRAEKFLAVAKEALRDIDES
jgi:uncharacterized protein (UPF0332 family)